MSMARSTEISGFLDGREYNASFLYEFCALLVGNGVYANELAPTATNDNMTVTYGSGHGWINGVLYKNTTPFDMEFDTADGALNRYDSIMLRLDLSQNEAYAVVEKGAFATSPTPPEITRNAETFDLKICDVYIPAGCTKITQAQIYDRRLDSAVCGVPVFPIEHLDMTTFCRQIENDLASFRSRQQKEFAAWVAEQEETNLATMAALVKTVRDTSTESRVEIRDILEAFNAYTEELKAKGDADIAAIAESLQDFQRTKREEFNTWFEEIKDTLSGDVAGNLTLKVNSLEEQQNIFMAMVMNNDFFSAILDDDGNPILDDDGDAVVGNWKYLLA